MNPMVAVVLGLIAAIACTVLALIFITPAKKRDTLNPFLRFLHDLFNFKYLVIEKVLKALYILSTAFCLVCGFFLLFSGYQTYGGWFGGGGFQSLAGTGLLVMILGPILVRISYEFMMMAVLAVNNIIQINAKLKNQNPTPVQTPPPAPVYQAPVQPAPVAAPSPENYVFCTRCGTRYDESKGGCPNCGAAEQPGDQQ